ncbi:maleylpyruvate isomerase family mycothiol-dependent enzyme [Pengzhenrongella sicca]|uniref:Maleylpyruvate isomerase family mycothiol-dependent enzyme n=1 Tax=Pengzhenrongella sicca TaxID=2819238 RepID=A0A8A4ZCR9_9MICO|nr:maleylpyruvate isomerase family mycothiol-dependent enzyme [Pengzhenrongella sicca]QTE28673.1 maleylpyruvate isomerase family mycothiol-dependent enzyme [Pengzhenrongella sicca]
MAVTGPDDAARVAPAELVPAIRGAHARLLASIAGCTDADVAAPSRLPGWSRGHVLAHLVGLAAAATRQIEYARRGALVDVYDGGRPARDAAIEAGAPASAAEHRSAITSATERIDALLADLTREDWSRPVRYRAGTALDMAQAWWREVEIHLTDLDLGPASGDWSVQLCEHLTAFLAERLPGGSALVLEAPDGWVQELGTGPTRVLRGARTDLVAWLAGREPAGPVVADDGAPPPALGPWPAPQPPQAPQEPEAAGR